MSLVEFAVAPWPIQEVGWARIVSWPAGQDPPRDH